MSGSSLDAEGRVHLSRSKLGFGEGARKARAAETGIGVDSWDVKCSRRYLEPPEGGHRLEDLERDQKRPLMDAAGTCLALSPFSRACQAGFHCWQTSCLGEVPATWTCVLAVTMAMITNDGERCSRSLSAH